MRRLDSIYQWKRYMDWW